MHLFVAIISAYLGVILVFLVACCALDSTANGRPLRWSRASVSRFVREWLGIAILVLLWPWGLFGPRRPQSRDAESSGKIPVLLVPGYLMNRSSMWVLASYLRRRGWGWV